MTKEELYQKYIVENFSRKECAKFFNVSQPSIKRAVSKFKLRKTQEQMDEIKSRIQKTFINKDLLYDLYITRNLSLKECANELNVTTVIVKRRLRDFNIKKTGEKFKEIHRTHANVTEESKEKRKNTVRNKYGVDNVSKSNIVKQKKNLTTRGHYGVDNPFQSEQIKKEISDIFLSRYGVPYACMRDECKKYNGNYSIPNAEFAELLDSYKINYEREFPLENYSYDFKINDILIEINPSIFHNSTLAPFGNPKDKNYHLRKSEIAKKYGYKCIHIFDWDDKGKTIKTFLLEKKRIYARKCVIKEVNLEDAKKFLSENHLQGYAKDKIRLGLYHNNELVEIMTFSKPRYNKNYDYELIRLCSSENVIGGAEKLFNCFLKNYSPRNVISYCDFSKFDGKVYEKLGFKAINKPQPSKHWINLKNERHITDNLLRQKGFDKLFKTNYGKGTSNEELMKMNDFIEVYDCGQITFVK